MTEKNRVWNYVRVLEDAVIILAFVVFIFLTLIVTGIL